MTQERTTPEPEPLELTPDDWRLIVEALRASAKPGRQELADNIERIIEHDFRFGPTGPEGT